LGQNSSWCLMSLKNYIMSLKKQNFEYFHLQWPTVYNYIHATCLMSSITISMVTSLKYWMTEELGSNSCEVLFCSSQHHPHQAMSYLMCSDRSFSRSKGNRHEIWTHTCV
jgi:hypothetical protein